MVTKAKVEFKKDNPDRMIFIDESVYDVPIKYLKVFITIPGYTESKTVTITPNKVNTLNAELFNLYQFPDGLYHFVVDSPDCVLEFDELNTTSLDVCIDKAIEELASCDTDLKLLKKLNDALIERAYAKQLDCNSISAYKLARKLICKDCN